MKISSEFWGWLRFFGTLLLGGVIVVAWIALTPDPETRWIKAPGGEGGEHWIHPDTQEERDYDSKGRLRHLKYIDGRYRIHSVTYDEEGTEVNHGISE